MLFHVAMTHTADNCPAYHIEKMAELLASLDRLDEVGRELNIKAHSLVWGAPDHVAFAVLEADSLGAIARYLNSVAIKQEFRITPVQHVSEVIAFGKEALAHAR
jgi:hypothetical protein